MIIAVVVLIVGLVAVFPSVGEQLACAASKAVGAVSGSPVSCAGEPGGGSGGEPGGGSGGEPGGGSGGEPGGGGQAGGSQTDPDSTGFVTSRTTAPGSGPGRVEFTVDVPDGADWTVQSDQPWLTVPDGGNGSGTVTGTVHANPGGSRTATLTFTGPDGETYTQKVTQPGGRADTVVLGDSFSAGNGSSKNNPDRGPDGDCHDIDGNALPSHRSSMSWGRQLEMGTANSAGTPNISLSGFGPCSGATVTGTDLTGAPGSSALLDQIEANKDALAQADQVAFSIGGNDIGFASIVADCVAPFGLSTVAKCHNAVVAGRERINGPLSDNLETAYRAMLEATKDKGATIYVVGYPPMVELDDTGGGFLDYGEVEPENRQEVVDMINELNSQIATTVDRVNASNPDGARLVFVDPTKPGSGFEGHSLTDDVPYYEGLDLQFPPWRGAEAWSYHPNEAGNEEYARWIGWHMMGNR